MKKNIEIEVPEGYTIAVTKNEDGKQIICFVPEKKDWQPKDGDIVTYGAKNIKNIGIFHKMGDYENEHGDYVTLFDINSINEKIYYNIKIWPNNNMRPANEEERLCLLNALAKKGKRWNAEKKCVEDYIRPRRKYCVIGWKPYYYIDSFFNVACGRDHCEPEVQSRYDMGNYFLSWGAAERVATQIREIFRSSEAE